MITYLIKIDNMVFLFQLRYRFFLFNSLELDIYNYIQKER